MRVSDAVNYNDFKHTRQIQVTLTLFPSELTTDSIEKVIVKKLINIYENVCYDEMFIKEITGIMPIESGKVGGFGEVNYIVKFEANVLCPKPNDIMFGTIQKIITSGVFVQYDVLRCFVKKQCFTSEEWNELRQNHKMKVELNTFRFQNFNGTLNCVGQAF